MILIILGICIASIIFVLCIASCLERTYDVNNKHVFITGGSSGIGLEAAKVYAKKGANVTIAARNLLRLEEAKDVIEPFCGSGRSVLVVAVDVSSSYEEVKNKMDVAIQKFGPIDVLVNSAGISIAGEFDKVDIGQFERMLKVNVLGSVYPTRVVVEGMKKRFEEETANGKNKAPGGRIVFVSSQVAQAALHGYSAYAASKWALRGIAESLQMEMKPYDVFISVCYPPDTDTPGYVEEMESKPLITKKLSESGSVFLPDQVAKDIVTYSAKGYFGIATGLDGHLLKIAHPGMTPVNSFFEVLEQVCFAGIARIIAVFVIMDWDATVRKESLRKTN